MCELRTCKKCNEELPLTTEFFHKRFDNGNFTYKCKKCVNKHNCSGKLEARLTKIQKLLDEGKSNCKTCKQDKLISEFHIAKHRPSGYNSSCKDCDKERMKNWRCNNVKAIRESRARKEFNLSKSQYDLLMSTSNCQICNKEFKPLSIDYRNDRNIDHCHETGVVRGVLCNSCNTGLGKLGDNIEGLEKALNYLKSTTYEHI